MLMLMLMLMLRHSRARQQPSLSQYNSRAPDCAPPAHSHYMAAQPEGTQHE